ncbi:MAG: hypothetical protein ACLFPF_07180 [Halanaerobiales bacterium]
MSKLNGIWRFDYSKTQGEENGDRHTFVEIDGEMKEFTECCHIAHTQKRDYVPHKERYEDSVFLGGINNPTIKRGCLLNVQKSED